MKRRSSRVKSANLWRGITLLAVTLAGLVSLAPAANAGGAGTQAVTYFQFRTNQNPSRCLDAGGQVNGAVVQIFTCNGTVNQQWRMRTVDGVFFELIVASSGRCMEVANASQTAGSRIQILDCNGQFNQQWEQVASPVSGFVHLRARHSGRCASAFGRNGDRVPVLQATCFEINDQIWNIS
jgi:hypothetical protein